MAMNTAEVIGLDQPFGQTKINALFAVDRLRQLHRAGLKILVHCLSGKDRAHTVVAKYLEESWEGTRGKAEKRPNCIPDWSWWD